MSGPAPVETNLLLADDRVLLVEGRPESLRSAVMFRMSNAPREESLATATSSEISPPPPQPRPAVTPKGTFE